MSTVAKKAAKNKSAASSRQNTPSKLSSSVPSLASQKTSTSISTYKSSKSKSPSNSKILF